MEQCRQVTLLGDSILKGIQVDLGSRRYRAQNEMDTAALESEFRLSIHNDAHFGATVRKGAACWIGCWTGAPPAIFW